MKKENKSLFIYTALIFLVSILMILIAFVGQNNIQNMQPETDSSGVSITDKVNQLSEENRLLLQERINLTRRNEGLTSRNDTLTKDNELLTKYLDIDSLLDEGKKDEAKIIYDSIDATLLSETQKIYYDKLTLRLNK